MVRIRLLPATGYWMFICNRKFWRAEDWLTRGEPETFYKISEHNKYEMKVGELGLLRVNRRPGKPLSADGKAYHPSMLALFEVVRKPEFIADPDLRDATTDEGFEGPRWRVRLRLLSDFRRHPVNLSELPTTADFNFVHNALPTSSIPISRDAFEIILRRADIQLDQLEARTSELPASAELQKLVTTHEGISKLEQQFAKAEPTIRKKLSRYIERGSIGQKVKSARHGMCQICVAIGQQAIAFTDRKQLPYSEAHHIMPVSTLQHGVLSHLNIMVLCPNHHRQAHYGCFDVLENTAENWIVMIDGTPLTIAKTELVGKP